MSQISTGRIEAVLRATKRWQNDLVDTTGRNRLRRYRDLKTGTLDLTPGRANGLDARVLDRLLENKTVSLSELFPNTLEDSDDFTAFNDARRRLAAIHKTALTYLEEKGIETLFAAIGLATWEVDSGTPPNAPMILLPLDVEPSGAAARDFTVKIAGDAHLNPVLTHILRSEHDVKTDDEEADVAEDPPINVDGFLDMFNRFEKSWKALPNLSIEFRAVAAIFSYSTMPLVADLEQNGELFAGSDIVAAIAGDGNARESLASRICDPDPNQPDIDPPSREFLVLDADSSQHMAINRVLGGESLVIQGPPGTGKSQTIANLITALIARGKRVLFVAEKRAAIEAVTKRLEQVGLSELVMDMHGGVTSRRDFARTLNDFLERVSSVPAHDYSALHRRLGRHRKPLISNDSTLHEPRNPWKLSVFQMRERLLAIPKAAHTRLRLTTKATLALDSEGFEQLTNEIEEWIALGGHELAENHPEWSRSSIKTIKGARQAHELASELSYSYLPVARDTLFTALDEVGLARPETVSEWGQLREFLSRVEKTLNRCHPEVYELDHAMLGQALAPAAKSSLSRLFAQVFSSEFRTAKQSLQATLREPAEFSSTIALDLVMEVGKQVDEWQQHCLDGKSAEKAEVHLYDSARHTSRGNKPRVPDDFSAMASRLGELAEALSHFMELTGLGGLDQTSHTDLAEALDRMASGLTVVANLPRIRKLEARFRGAGIESVIHCIGEDIPPECAAQAVEHAWLWRVLDDLEFEDRQIAAFDSNAHSRECRKYVETDIQHRNSTPQRVQRLTAEAIIATMNNHPQETMLVKREAVKKRRHLSPRQLFARAPHVLSTLRPCWTMSPILAAEMIPADRQLFDVVIFDEASQIPPAEAIGSLARASQTVIAGDSRQLPPTTFFSRMGDEDVEDDDDNDLSLTQDIESLLDAAGTLLRDKMLQWHYRSRDDRLIAFSNSHIYGGSLTAFPGAIVSTPVTHHLVPYRPIIGVKGTRSNPDEVEKVVELVLEHTRTTPHETLGVIAFGQHHADNIDNALLRRLSQENDPSLDDFFSERNEERFFVKNIERVQGDERDVIILSIGYHKDDNGNLPYRFGPILQEGGERRLNVAVTRARSRITLVSSFSHRDMDPSRSSAKGVELLRKYLEYATSGGENLGADLSEEPLNAFELSIKDGLERRGIPVTPQYGVSGYRIDFACAHPDELGRMVLAIEADGASYHSAPTARDRDRLRQQVLESKGWRFHRIWSTAWFRDREAELDKAEEAWKRAVDVSNEEETLPDSSSSVRADLKPPLTSSTQRGRRPWVPRKGSRGYNSIADYRQSQLVNLARWIESDTLLRTDDDLIREMMNELGFKRSGKRITDALRIAIKSARR